MLLFRRMSIGMNILDVVRALRHYCSTIWEYDRVTEKVFVHHDVLLPQTVGKRFSLEELSDRYKSRYLFEGDFSSWDKYFDKNALQRCFSPDFSETSFTLRFIYPEADPCWYQCVIQKADDSHLLVFDRDIYDNVKELYLRKNFESIFENVFYVDVESGRFIHHKNKPNTLFLQASNKYDDMIARFVQNHVSHPDPATAAKLLSLENVRRELKSEPRYSLYLTVHDDERLSYNCLIFSYLDSSQKVIVVARTDISDIAEKYENRLRRYQEDSWHDVLTGINNRNYYEEKIKNTRPKVGLAVIDLDEFKLCNDIFGHAGGDAALCAAVAAIRKSMSDDDLLIRFGGDEFLLLTHDIDAERFESKLSEIRDRIHVSEVPGYPEMVLSVSIGGIILDGETVEKGVLRADKLMYRAKDDKNTVITEGSSLSKAEGDVIPFGDETVKYPILIVDDSELDREILSSMLSDHFQILTASCGEECIEILRRCGSKLLLILLDIVMPGMSGFDVLSYMNRHSVIDEIPVIMISGENSEQYIRRAYSMGVSDYISRPFDSKVVYQRIYNIIKLHFRQRKLISFLAKQARAKECNSRTLIDILSQVIEFRNGESGDHVRHVRKITEILLECVITKTDAYNLSWQDRSLIATASMLHDIGKTAIDEAILNKPGRLTEAEYKTVKNHTVLGAVLLSQIHDYENEKLMKTAIEICRWHHERYNGKGYPDRLCGEEIPISAQVVSLADAYDALTGKRAYKDPVAHDEALRMILRGECGAFNPLLLDCLAETHEEIRKRVYEDSSVNNKIDGTA